MHEPANEATLKFTFIMYKVPIKTCTELCMDSSMSIVYVANSLGPGVHRLTWLTSYLSGTRLTYIAEILLEIISLWNLPADLRVGWGCKNQ